MRLKRNTFDRGRRFFLVFISMFLTDSLIFAINADATMKAISRYGVIVLAVYYAASHLFLTGFRIDKHVIFLSASAIISSLLAGYLFNGFYYYSFVAGIWIAYVISKKYSLEEYADEFCAIMRWVGILSLVCFLFRNTLVNSDLFPIVTSEKDNQYRWLGVISIPLKAHQRGRNFGPFWEPGTYQIYINMALYFSLFVLKGNNKIRDAIIFVFVGLSTFSGSLLIPMLLIFIAYALKHKNIKTVILLSVVALGAGVIVRSGMFDSVLTKMMGKDSNNSLLFRWVGFEGGIRGFLRNPLFGSAPALNEAIKLELAQKYFGSNYASNATTIANLFAYFGLYVGGYLLISFYRSFSSLGEARMISLICFTAFFFATSNENMTTSLFFLTMCFLKSESYLYSQSDALSLRAKGG